MGEPEEVEGGCDFYIGAKLPSSSGNRNRLKEEEKGDDVVTVHSLGIHIIGDQRISGSQCTRFSWRQ